MVLLRKGILGTLTVLLFGVRLASAQSFPPPASLSTLCWIAYAPSVFNPETNSYLKRSDLEADLTALYAAGFRGLVTYGVEASLADIPAVAAEVGFEAVLIGVWLPLEDQLDRAIGIQNDITVGYVIGNENLKADDTPVDQPGYFRADLEAAIERIHTETGLPATTTEQIGDYTSSTFGYLLDLGDWIFPNVHPYYANVTEPGAAIEWTTNIYDNLQSLRPTRTVMFKEVGLPSAGREDLSPASQNEYYRGLWFTDVLYAHFEAFDQPWKVHTPVEPYWGLFESDRTPKPAANTACASPPARNYFTDDPINLTWNWVTSAAEYQIQIDRSSTFAQPFTAMRTVTERTATIEGLPDGLYYWRVRARPEGTWSQTEEFVIDAAQP